MACRVAFVDNHHPMTDEPANIPIEHVPCIKCDYDLFGVRNDEVCPECGCPISRSLDPRRLLFAAPRSLRFMQASLLLWILIQSSVLGDMLLRQFFMMSYYHHVMGLFRLMFGASLVLMFFALWRDGRTLSRVAVHVWMLFALLEYAQSGAPYRSIGGPIGTEAPRLMWLFVAMYVAATAGYFLLVAWCVSRIPRRTLVMGLCIVSVLWVVHEAIQTSSGIFFLWTNAWVLASTVMLVIAFMAIRSTLSLRVRLEDAQALEVART